MGSVDKPRIVVIGTSGSGKTTLARMLADALGVQHVELDGLYWRKGWVEAPQEEFRAAVAAAAMEDAWVADGNYGTVRDLLWARATHLVWLDLPFLLVLWRIAWRTIRHSMSRKELYGGNRESLWMAFLSRDSIIWWMLRTYGRRRRQYPRLFERPEYQHVRVIVVRSRLEAKRLVKEVKRWTPLHTGS